MKKTLKATAVIVMCCAVMVVVVIYTPKPTPEPTKERETLEESLQRLERERAHFTLTNEALGKANEAIMKVLEATRQDAKKVRFNAEGEPYLEPPDLNPLIEASTGAIEGLTEASKAVKQRTEALQQLNEEKPPLHSLVEANIKANTELVAALAEVSTEMNALADLLHHLNKENTRPKTLRKVSNATFKGTHAIAKALTVQSDARKAHHEYQRAQIDARW